jgi:hypothetical protein
MSVRRSRKLLGLATAAVLASSSLITAGPAQADPVYRFVADYSVFRVLCVRAGDAGVQADRWDAYQCRPRLVGLDVFWSLWVTP